MFDMIYVVVLILLGILTVPLILDYSYKFKFEIRNKLLKTTLYFLWIICFLFLEIDDLVELFTKNIRPLLTFNVLIH